MSRWCGCRDIGWIAVSVEAQSLNPLPLLLNVREIFGWSGVPKAELFLWLESVEKVRAVNLAKEKRALNVFLVPFHPLSTRHVLHTGVISARVAQPTTQDACSKEAHAVAEGDTGVISERASDDQDQGAGKSSSARIYASLSPTLLTRSKRWNQEHRRDFTIYLRYFFKHPSWGGGLRRRDFSQIEYMQRKTSRLLDTTFAPKSVKNINLPKDIEADMQELGLAHWKRAFRDASSASSTTSATPIPSSNST